MSRSVYYFKEETHVYQKTKKEVAYEYSYYSSNPVEIGETGEREDAYADQVTPPRVCNIH